MSWFVYILRCADDSLYTGITRDLTRRIEEHNLGGRGARYTRGRTPVTLVYSEAAKDRSAASQREWQIKQLSRDQKLKMITEAAENVD